VVSVEGEDVRKNKDEEGAWELAMFQALCGVDEEGGEALEEWGAGGGGVGQRQRSDKKTTQNDDNLPTT